MLLINNRPVLDKDLSKLVKEALDGREFNEGRNRIVEFKLKSWRPNPDYKVDDPEEGGRRFLGPMYLSVPSRYSTKDWSNPSSIGKVRWQYVSGDGLRDDKGNFINNGSEIDIEFHAGFIRVNIDTHPDLYVFLKLSPLCENNPKENVNSSSAVYEEVDTNRLRRQQYKDAGMEASRVATIWNMDDERAKRLASGMALLVGPDLQDITIVKGALINFAKTSGEAFDTFANDEALLLAQQIDVLFARGKLVYEASTSRVGYQWEEGFKHLADVPMARQADKSKYLADHLLANNEAAVEIIRKLAQS